MLGPAALPRPGYEGCRRTRMVEEPPEGHVGRHAASPEPASRTDPHSRLPDATLTARVRSAGAPSRKGSRIEGRPRHSAAGPGSHLRVRIVAFSHVLAAARPAGARLAILVAVMLVGSWTGAAWAETVTGVASVIDGNTLEVAGHLIRLQGIDAPDLDQICQDRQGADYACGQRARSALSAHLRDAPVSCQTSAQDEAGRHRALCQGPSGDVNAWMVRAGHAASVRGPDALYAEEDRRAWARRVGLWAGVFEEPAEWRRQHQHTADDLRETRNRQIARAP